MSYHSETLYIIHYEHGSSSPLPPPILGGDLKISDQNNWGGGGGGGWAKNKIWGGPKILGGACEPQLYHGCCVKRYSFMLLRF